MDERQRSLCKELASLESGQAVDWLISRYPVDSTDWGEALVLLPHRSWKRGDQKTLARYYFNLLPFASERGYERFSSIMSVGILLDCVKERILKGPINFDLLRYHFIPAVMKAAKNESDREAIHNFIDWLKLAEESAE